MSESQLQRAVRQLHRLADRLETEWQRRSDDPQRRARLVNSYVVQAGEELLPFVEQIGGAVLAEREMIERIEAAKQPDERLSERHLREKTAVAVLHQASQRWIHDRGAGDPYVLRHREKDTELIYCDLIRAVAEKLTTVEAAEKPAATTPRPGYYPSRAFPKKLTSQSEKLWKAKDRGLIPAYQDDRGRWLFSWAHVHQLWPQDVPQGPPRV